MISNLPTDTDDQTGEGVYSWPSSEAWATATDNALWGMEMDQVLALYIAQSLEEAGGGNESAPHGQLPVRLWKRKQRPPAPG